MDYTNTLNPQSARIDSRILKHLLHEASEMLEEAQTHALVEKQNETTAYVLAQANWRMTATCIWAISELFPMSAEKQPSAQLHAPTPIFSRSDNAMSPELEAFILRVDRLHERARRLDELSRGPMVSTAPETRPESKEPATIIPLFGKTSGASENADPVGQVRSRVRRAMGGSEK